MADYTTGNTGYTVQVDAGDYTFQAELDLTNTKNNMAVQFLYVDSTNTQASVLGNTITAGKSGVSQCTANVPTAQQVTLRAVYLAANVTDDDFNIRHEKLEKGTIATPWNLSPNDVATVTAVSTLSDTVEGLTDTVSDNSGDISTLKNTATTFQTALTNSQGDISGLQQKADSFTVSIGNLNTDAVKQSGNYAGLTINQNGLTQVAGSTSVYLSNTHGLEIQKSGSDVFHVDTSGNLTMQGDITAGNISGVNFTGNNLTLAGTLGVTGAISAAGGNVVLSSSGLTIKGGNLAIADSSGNTTTYIRDDGTFITNEGIFTGSITQSTLKIHNDDNSFTAILGEISDDYWGFQLTAANNETWIDQNGIHNSNNSTLDAYLNAGCLSLTDSDNGGVKTEITGYQLQFYGNTSSVESNQPRLIFNGGNTLEQINAGATPTGIMFNSYGNIVPTAGSAVWSVFDLKGNRVITADTTGNDRVIIKRDLYLATPDKDWSNAWTYNDYGRLEQYKDGSLLIASMSNNLNLNSPTGRTFINGTAFFEHTDNGLLSSGGQWINLVNGPIAQGTTPDTIHHYLGSMVLHELEYHTLTNISLASEKKNISELDEDMLYTELLGTDIRSFQYLSEDSSDAVHIGPVIDNVNHKLNIANDFISSDGKGVSDHNLISALIIAVKKQAQEISNLNLQVSNLEMESK